MGRADLSLPLELTMKTTNVLSGLHCVGAKPFGLRVHIIEIHIQSTSEVFPSL